MASAGSEIIGNRIHAPVPIIVCFPTCNGGLILANADGIDVGHVGAPLMVTGKIVIKDNDMEDLSGSNSIGALPLTIPIQADTAAADFEITDNTIRNTSTDGISVLRMQNSSVRIADNRIEMGGGRCPRVS